MRASHGKRMMGGGGEGGAGEPCKALRQLAALPSQSATRAVHAARACRMAASQQHACMLLVSTCERHTSTPTERPCATHPTHRKVLVALPVARDDVVPLRLEALGQVAADEAPRAGDADLEPLLGCWCGLGWPWLCSSVCMERPGPKQVEPPVISRPVQAQSRPGSRNPLTLRAERPRGRRRPPACAMRQSPWLAAGWSVCAG